MSSLEGCIKKAGKALRRSDADAIRKIRDDIYGAGDVTRSAANQQAVDEYLEILETERMDVLRQAEKQGGVLADRSLSPSEFSKQTAQRLKDQAKEARARIEKQIKQKAAKPPLRFKIEDIDPFMQKLVDERPETPQSVTHKLGKVIETVAEQAAIPPKNLRGFLEKISGGKTSQLSKAGILRLLPQNKLHEVVREGMPSTKRYVEHIADMNAYMERLMEGHADVGKTWLAFNRKFKDGAKLLGELIHATTLAGVDLANFQMPSETELKRMNKTKRKMWAKRQEDYDLLLPHWEKLGRIGTKVDYEEIAYQRGKLGLDGIHDEGTMKVVKTTSMPEGQALFLQAFKVYENMRQRSIESLENRITAAENDVKTRRAKITGLRQLFESGKIPQYAPLTRFGKYAAVAKDPETDEVVAFFKRENREERNRIVAELQKAGFRAYPIDEADTLSDADMAKRIDPNFVTQVIDIVGEEVGMDEGRMSLQDEIWQMYLRSLPEMSARKAFIHRTGRLGFSMDALRAFGDHTFHGTHQLAKLKYGYQLQNDLDEADEDATMLTGRAAMIEGLQQGRNPEGHKGETPHEVLWGMVPGYRPLFKATMTKEALENWKAANPDEYTASPPPENINATNEIMDELHKIAEHEGPWARPVHDSLAQRHTFNMNPKSSAWATNLTAFGFLWFLSSSPAAGVLNLTQTAIVGYPILRAAFNGQGAGMELLRATKEYATSGEMRSGAFDKKLRNDQITHSDGTTTESDIGEKAAFKYFEIMGMYAKTRTRDLMGIAERGLHQNDKMAQAAEMAGWIFHKTEEANRIVTSMAAYRLARKKYGGDKSMTPQQVHEKALEMGMELTLDSHFDYTNTNRPPIMQGDLGRVVFLFRNYSVNMQYRLFRDFKDGIWKNENISKADRIAARSRFVGIISMTSLFAGMSGWPLLAATHGLLDMMFGDDDDPFDSRTEFRVYLTEIFGDKIGEAIYKGPWDAFTGMSLSNRASLNNLWIREIPDSLRGQDLLLHLAGEGLGPIFGVGMNFAQGFQDMQEDHSWRAFEKIVPKAVADVSKTLRFATQGAQTRQGDMILPPETFDYSSLPGARNLLGQFMGFTPSELSKQYEQNRAVKDMEARLRRRHDQLINRYFMSSKLGDRKVTRETMRDIAAWNRANPTYPISASTLRRSAKARAQYDMRTVGGIALDKRLYYLHEQLRFTK